MDYIQQGLAQIRREMLLWLENNQS